MRKIPYAGIELTSQRVRGLGGTSELPGRPASEKFNMHIYVCNYSIALCILCRTMFVCMPSQPGKVANPARGQQLNRENELFAVLVRA